MIDLTGQIVELIRLAATDLPAEMENKLRAAAENEEPGSPARSVFDTILKNIALARQRSAPICQDTGTPQFFVNYPAGWSTIELKKQIRSAVAKATEKLYLRPNAVDALNGKNSGDNLGGEFYPSIHFEETEGDSLVIDLMLKGGGSENCGAQHSLPHTRLKAARDLDGVRKAVLDMVNEAQGEGCAPGFVGIAIGGDRTTAFEAAKRTLLEPLDQTNTNQELADLEKRITEEANQLGIGPMGFGGKTTILGAKVTSMYRLPASYFVTMSYMCWAYRRRRMTYRDSQVVFE